ncbi:hypothetical protein L3V79_04530 [Thiotrichales bacterium 19S9-12]|nr:hypothetical protein [Thiotrichales bacterium 19S9-11]MCF6811625.1 hypothetical protein [Thiotrichales bacterium 19S9-12]
MASKNKKPQKEKKADTTNQNLRLAEIQKLDMSKWTTEKKIALISIAVELEINLIENNVYYYNDKYQKLQALLKELSDNVINTDKFKSLTDKEKNSLKKPIAKRIKEIHTLLIDQKKAYEEALKKETSQKRYDNLCSMEQNIMPLAPEIAEAIIKTKKEIMAKIELGKIAEIDCPYACLSKLQILNSKQYEDKNTTNAISLAIESYKKIITKNTESEISKEENLYKKCDISLKGLKATRGYEPLLKTLAVVLNLMLYLEESNSLEETKASGYSIDLSFIDKLKILQQIKSVVGETEELKKLRQCLLNSKNYLTPTGKIVTFDCTYKPSRDTSNLKTITLPPSLLLKEEMDGIDQEEDIDQKEDNNLMTLD